MAGRIGALVILMFLAAVSAHAEVSVKIKDLSFIDGLKENQVYGYGLVVGLQGTGDTKKSPLTKSSLKNLLKNLGMEGDDITSANTAAVLVTAKLPAFVRIGDRIDVTVSSIGDAKSIEGGILIQSPLRGGDGAIYAVAQGTLSVPRIKNERRAVRTVAQIDGGAVVEREIYPEIVYRDKDNKEDQDKIFIVLREWDYTVGNSIIKAVANKYPESKPVMASGGRIQVSLLKDISIPEFISTIENIEITPAYRARVVVNERDGTIVTGGEVKVSAAMVSREGLTVEIKETGKKVSASELKDTATVKELVDSLNATGATTSDIISILKALEASGALHAELIVR
ncbi:MAG: flagellar basal body P-ring protein FlgI [Spirochaetes bacterium]|nr:flagellar basal body P-ring protein FlgI [Spirochaetota bacterium]